MTRKINLTFRAFMCISKEFACEQEYNETFDIGHSYAEALVDSSGGSLHIDENGDIEKHALLLIGKYGHPVYVVSTDFAYLEIASDELEKTYKQN